jgi:hypothetical protein
MESKRKFTFVIKGKNESPIEVSQKFLSEFKCLENYLQPIIEGDGTKFNLTKITSAVKVSEFLSFVENDMRLIAD